MIVCVSSPNGLACCDSIRSPQGVTRAAATGASQIASFHVNNKKYGGLGSNLIDLRRHSSFQVCVRRRKLPLPGLCFVLKENEAQVAEDGKQTLEFSDSFRESVESEQERLTTKAKALFATVAWSLGITGMAAAAIYYRFVFVMQGEELPYTEMLETVLVAAGAAVGMEFWARWVHRAFWHASLWCIHESHHRPRDGPFEMNDVFTILNSVPANVLLTYGLYCKGLVPSLCFGAGVGITVGGIAYILVHDGLIDRRFPVGPIGEIPYLRKVAAAHQIHHSDKFNGVPYGILLGPMELETVEGGLEELEKFVDRRKKASIGLSKAKYLR